MVLNNYWSLLAGISNNSFSLGSSAARYNIAYCRHMGTGDLVGINEVNMVNQPDSKPLAYQNTAYAPLARLKSFVGSGTTRPQSDDYCLQNDITSSFSNYTFTYQTLCEDNSCKVYCIITGTNNTGGTLTVSEVGIGKQISYCIDSDPDNKDVGIFLYVREVLDRPISVPSGLGFELVLEWVMS